MAKEVYGLTAEDAAAIKRMRRWQRNFKVNGARCINKEDGCEITLPTFRRQSSQATFPDKAFWVIIETQERDGTNNRWKYQATEAEKLTAGYGGWTAKLAISGGRVATGSTEADPPGNGIWVYNLIEDQNGATGQYGNGVSSDDLSGTGITVQPIPIGTRVLVTGVVTIPAVDPEDDDIEEWWVQYENGVSGPCTPPP
jgi:hypothetical protein